MPRNAHGPMCADAARGGPACAHAAIGNGAYGTPDHTWRMNNGQAQAWWEAPDGSRYLLACVRDDDASGAHGVAVWMLFPVENVWRRVPVPRGSRQAQRGGVNGPEPPPLTHAAAIRGCLFEAGVARHGRRWSRTELVSMVGAHEAQPHALKR
jgi:hypothetical protein